MRPIPASAVLCTVLMALPASSAAQGLPSDPDSGSPAGVVYELPVDRARDDAAPKREQRQASGDDRSDTSGGVSDPGSSGGSGTGDSSIRSENNFGTSSEVPGAESGTKGNSARADAGDQGGSSLPPDTTAVSSSSTAGDVEGPSDGIVYPLLAALLAVGAAIGIFAGMRAHGGRSA